jgi:hypothetical protein
MYVYKEYVQMMKLMSFSMKLIKYSLNINDVTIIVLSFGEMTRSIEEMGIRKRMYSYGHIESFITQDINNSVSYTFLYLISLFVSCKCLAALLSFMMSLVMFGTMPSGLFLSYRLFSHFKNLNVSVN